MPPDGGRPLHPHPQGIKDDAQQFHLDAESSMGSESLFSERIRSAKTQPPTWSMIQGFESTISGAGGGLVSATVVCPMDVVKTKLQAAGMSVRGPVDLVKQVVYREGIRGLYRGLGPTIFGYLPTWAIYFTSYESTKPRLESSYGEHSYKALVAAAMSSGIATTCLTNPLWVVKTRYMTQEYTQPGSKLYASTFDAFRRLYADNGIQIFFRGLVPSIFGAAHIAIQFPLYEKLKHVLYVSDKVQPPAWKILLSTTLSKMVASLVTYPHEVIRTRMQIAKTKTTFLAAITHIRRESWAAFYRGMGVNLCRTVPSTCVTFLTYERGTRFLRSLNA